MVLDKISQLKQNEVLLGKGGSGARRVKASFPQEKECHHVYNDLDLDIRVGSSLLREVSQNMTNDMHAGLTDRGQHAAWPPGATSTIWRSICATLAA